MLLPQWILFFWQTLFNEVLKHILHTFTVLCDLMKHFKRLIQSSLGFSIMVMNHQQLIRQKTLQRNH